jgi:hypothetical protein
MNIFHNMKIKVVVEWKDLMVKMIIW